MSQIDPQIYHCLFCQEGFMSMRAKENHERTIHIQMNSELEYDDGRSVVFHCRHCSKPFSNQIAVEKHEKGCDRK